MVVAKNGAINHHYTFKLQHGSTMYKLAVAIRIRSMPVIIIKPPILLGEARLTRWLITKAKDLGSWWHIRNPVKIHAARELLDEAQARMVTKAEIEYLEKLNQVIKEAIRPEFDCVRQDFDSVRQDMGMICEEISNLTGTITARFSSLEEKIQLLVNNLQKQ